MRQVSGNFTHRMVQHIYIFLIGIPALYKKPSSISNCSFSEVLSWRRAVLASFDASEARSSERSMRTSSLLTANAWASGPIVIPMTLKIFNTGIKPSLKMHITRKVEIWIVCVPAWMCFGAKVHINEFNDSLLFWVSEPKHRSNRIIELKIH